HIPESPQVIIVAVARVADGIAKLEPKSVRRVIAPYIIHPNGPCGVVQYILPAGHGVRHRRRLFFFGGDFLATCLISRHRSCFHWWGEDQTIGKLRVCEPSGMDVVLLKESIELGGKHLLPQPIELMHGPVQVDIMPGPIEIDDALPLIPTVAAGAGRAEEAA